jgi:hypothetical protein
MSTLSRATGTLKKRNERDYYPTIDPRAVMPLIPHLRPAQRYVEPCAGGGHLIDLLSAHGMTCALAMDIEPQTESGRSDIIKGDAFGISSAARCAQTGEKMPFITNPPWDRQILHVLIGHLAMLAPTWLLFDAAWKETKQAARFGPIYVKIVSLGRLKWVPDSPHQSTDDCSWYLFDARHDEAPTEYYWPSSNRDAGPMLF